MVALANMSRTNFHNRLNDLTGLTPEQFLNDFRLKKAIVLLEKTDHSIIEIAQMTGFGNALNITRAFKQRMGMTPDHYRNQNAHQTTSMHTESIKEAFTTEHNDTTTQDKSDEENMVAVSEPDITDEYEIIED